MKGQTLLLVLLTLGLAIGRIEAFFSFSMSFKHQFDHINKYLVDNVDSKKASDVDDVNLNMVVASTWLQQLKATGKSNSLVRALEILVSIKTNDCDRESFNNLKAANDATSGKSVEHGLPKRPVDRLVRHYVLEHAAKCFEVYPSLVAQKRALLSKGVEETVEKIKYNNRIVKEIKWLGGGSIRQISGDFTYDYMEWILLGDMLKDLDVSSVMPNIEGAKESRVRELFNKNVILPCKEYDDKIGKEILDLIDFDLFVTNSAGVGGASSQVIGDEIGMSICHRLVNDKRIRGWAIRHLVKRVGLREV